MMRGSEDLVSGPMLYDTTLQHHDNLIRDGSYGCQIVSDEQVRNVELVLKVL